MKKIALVGLSNVGKSTLFNKLCGRSLSISFDEEDTTVDYITYVLEDKILVDTCGLHNQKSFDSLSGKYILESDLVLFVIDGRQQPSHKEIELCKFLRRQKKEIVLICNKTESQSISENEAKKLPVDKIFFLSSEHSIGIDNLKNYLNIKKQEKDKRSLVGIVGRANAGKSTLINCLLGYERVVTRNEVGTTRDSVLISGETSHYKVDFLDTAGYHDDKNVLDFVTKKRRMQSLKHINGAVVIFDGEKGLTKVDKQIFSEIKEIAHFLIVCVNKIDLMIRPESFDYINIPKHIPIIPICAKENKIKVLTKQLDLCISNLKIKIPTSKINQMIQEKQPRFKDKDNRTLKIKYFFQKQNDPMVIAYKSIKRMHPASETQFIRIFAEYFNLEGINIKLQQMQ